MAPTKMSRYWKKFRQMSCHDIYGTLKRWRKDANFITTIVLYSLLTCLIFSCLIYVIENSDGEVHVHFIDSLFLGVSAFTASGLNSAAFTQYSKASLVMLYMTVQFGSIVLLTTLPSILRVRTFRKRMRLIKAHLQTVETEKGTLNDLRMYDAISKRANICYLIIVGCFFYWFVCQAVFFSLVVVDRDAWWSLFHVTSAFNNAGFALSPNNMYPIRHNNYLLICFSFLMPLGNTLFPVFFRLQMIAWWHILDILCRTISNKERTFFGSTLRDWRDATETLVDNPRDHYTHMFEPKDTFILFILWVILTVSEFVMFIPEFNTDIFPENASLGNQLCIAVFQTVTVRTTGFSAMDLSKVHIGHLAFWILMMYVSAYPFIVAEQVTSSAKKDERDDGNDYKRYKQEAVNFVGRDLIWLFTAAMVICFAENYDMQTTDHGNHNDSFLRVLFEISSAFGTVGLSLSYPNPPGVSFSGDMNTFSKLVMILVMFFGKHRGLPPGIDKSIIIDENAMLDDISEIAQPASREGSQRDLDSLRSNASSNEQALLSPARSPGASLMSPKHEYLMQRSHSLNFGPQSTNNGERLALWSPAMGAMSDSSQDRREGHFPPVITSPTTSGQGGAGGDYELLEGSTNHTIMTRSKSWHGGMGGAARGAGGSSGYGTADDRTEE